MNPPLIMLIKLKLEEERASNIIKIKMRRNLASATSDTYKLGTATFKNGQPEQFLAILKNFKIKINGKETTSIYGQINYIRMMLHGEALR